MLSSNKQQQECFFPTSNPRAKQISLAYPLRIPCVSLAYPLRISCVFLAQRNFSHYPFFFFFLRNYIRIIRLVRSKFRNLQKKIYILLSKGYVQKILAFIARLVSRAYLFGKGHYLVSLVSLVSLILQGRDRRRDNKRAIMVIQLLLERNVYYFLFVSLFCK